MCSSNGDEVAYSEFVNRYIKDCEIICNKICRYRRLDNHVGLQIVTDTFEKLRLYKSWKSSEASNKDERKAITGFLFRIALNLFNDYYNKTKKDSEPYSTYFDDLSQEIYSVNDLREKKAITERILKKLNANERVVLTTDIEYKRHHKYLPDKIVEKLSGDLKVKPATIRKIRERAINKVKKAIDEYNQQQ